MDGCPRTRRYNQATVLYARKGMPLVDGYGLAGLAVHMAFETRRA
jgi:hypothetical protein